MATILVTGAGRGLGLEFTRQLAARGDTVFATVRNPDRADALRAVEGDIRIVALDVSEPTSIEAAAQAVAEQTDHLDLLVNNAGINSRGVPSDQANVRFGALEPKGILRMVEVNAIGPLLVTQAFAGLLAKSERGRVLSISSWLGSIDRKQSGGNYGYCASKTTLNMLMRAAAFDLAQQGIVSVVANPGWVSTDMGGPRAQLTPEQSVAGLVRVTDTLTLDHAGRFLQWDGSEHPW
jgi:NAD(P)-dependent dehydrogenase (short-subunit alcohol dehydrogenase family)